MPETYTYQFPESPYWVKIQGASAITDQLDSDSDRFLSEVTRLKKLTISLPGSQQINASVPVGEDGCLNPGTHGLTSQYDDLSPLNQNLINNLPNIMQAWFNPVRLTGVGQSSTFVLNLQSPNDALLMSGLGVGITKLTGAEGVVAGVYQLDLNASYSGVLKKGDHPYSIQVKVRVQIDGGVSDEPYTIVSNVLSIKGTTVSQVLSDQWRDDNLSDEQAVNHQGRIKVAVQDPDADRPQMREAGGDVAGRVLQNMREEQWESDKSQGAESIALARYPLPEQWQQRIAYYREVVKQLPGHALWASHIHNYGKKDIGVMRSQPAEALQYTTDVDFCGMLNQCGTEEQVDAYLAGALREIGDIRSLLFKGIESVKPYQVVALLLAQIDADKLDMFLGSDFAKQKVIPHLQNLDASQYLNLLALNANLETSLPRYINKKRVTSSMRVTEFGDKCFVTKPAGLFVRIWRSLVERFCAFFGVIDGRRQEMLREIQKTDWNDSVKTLMMEAVVPDHGLRQSNVEFLTPKQLKEFYDSKKDRLKSALTHFDGNSNQKLQDGTLFSNFKNARTLTVEQALFGDPEQEYADSVLKHHAQAMLVFMASDHLRSKFPGSNESFKDLLQKHEFLKNEVQRICDDKASKVTNIDDFNSAYNGMCEVEYDLSENLSNKKTELERQKCEREKAEKKQKDYKKVLIKCFEKKRDVRDKELEMIAASKDLEEAEEKLKRASTAARYSKWDRIVSELKKLKDALKSQLENLQSVDVPATDLGSEAKVKVFKDAIDKHLEDIVDRDDKSHVLGLLDDFDKSDGGDKLRSLLGSSDTSLADRICSVIAKDTDKSKALLESYGCDLKQAGATELLDAVCEHNQPVVLDIIKDLIDDAVSKAKKVAFINRSVNQQPDLVKQLVSGDEGQETAVKILQLYGYDLGQPVAKTLFTEVCGQAWVVNVIKSCVSDDAIDQEKKKALLGCPVAQQPDLMDALVADDVTTPKKILELYDYNLDQPVAKTLFTEVCKQAWAVDFIKSCVRDDAIDQEKKKALLDHYADSCEEGSMKALVTADVTTAKNILKVYKCELESGAAPAGAPKRLNRLCQKAAERVLSHDQPLFDYLQEYATPAVWLHLLEKGGLSRDGGESNWCAAFLRGFEDQSYDYFKDHMDAEQGDELRRWVASQLLTEYQDCLLRGTGKDAGGMLREATLAQWLEFLNTASDEALKSLQDSGVLRTQLQAVFPGPHEGAVWPLAYKDLLTNLLVHVPALNTHLAQCYANDVTACVENNEELLMGTDAAKMLSLLPMESVEINASTFIAAATGAGVDPDHVDQKADEGLGDELDEQHVVLAAQALAQIMQHLCVSYEDCSFDDDSERSSDLNAYLRNLMQGTKTELPGMPGGLTSAARWKLFTTPKPCAAEAAGRRGQAVVAY